MANQSWFEGIFPSYGDNWDPAKNYVGVGFYPGQALQSRELLEIQSILLYQTSTANRSLFKHGQPRIDLEEESLTDVTLSPVKVSGNTFTFKRNAQFFTNFKLSPSVTALSRPNGLWVTLPFSTTEHTETITQPTNTHFVGFNMTLQEVDYTTDSGLLDPASNEHANSGAIGAKRYQYKVNVDTSGNFLTTVALKRRQGSLFVPIAYYNNGNYYWGYSAPDTLALIPTA